MSGSGEMAVRGLDWAWQCGHFEWSESLIAILFSEIVAVGKSGSGSLGSVVVAIGFGGSGCV
jgi:hypothetical protein